MIRNILDRIIPAPTIHHFENLTPANLDDVLGPPFGEALETTWKLHPDFTKLTQMEVEFGNDFNGIAGGQIDGTDDIGFAMSTRKKAFSERIIARTYERNLLPDSLRGTKQEVTVMRLFAMAHEIGHCVQHCAEFTDMYGEFDGTSYDMRENYERYINSDAEANADYIAAFIVGNMTSIERFVDFEPPVQPPREWRDWVAEHPVDETIARYGHKNYDKKTPYERAYDAFDHFDTIVDALDGSLARIAQFAKSRT